MPRWPSSEGAQADRGRPRRPHPFARARGGADRGPHRRRARRRPDRHGPLADALFRGLDARRRRRHPGHRQPQPGRLQRLQDAARTAARCSARRSRTSAAAPREGDWSEGAGKVSEHDILDDYVDAPGQGLRRQAPTASAGTRATAPAARSLEKLVKRLPGEHHTLYTEVDGTFPNHHPDPTVEANLADLKKLVADKGLDFGIAFDGDARPHRRGRRPGPRDLGRPVADHPRRPGARRTCPARRSSPTSRPARPCSTASPRWAARR